MKKKLKPVQRGESRPAPLPDQRLAVAERVDYGNQNTYSQTDWNNISAYATVNGYGPYGQAYAPPPQPVPVDQPTYFQVLLQQVLKRYKLAAGWLAIAAVATFLVVTKYGKPTWKAEGALYYSPNYSYAHKRYYTPPNIQTIVALTKTPDLLEKARLDLQLPTSASDLQTKLTVNTIKQSDLISIAYEGPDKETSEALVNRLLTLAIEHYDEHRRKLSGKSLVDLEEDLLKAERDELSARNEMNERLGRIGIFDAKVEMATLIQTIANLESEIRKTRNDKENWEVELRGMNDRITAFVADLQNKENVGVTAEEQSRMRDIKDIKEKQLQRQREVEIAKPKLEAKEKLYRSYLPLARQGFVSRNELDTLEAEIKELKVIVQKTKEISSLEDELKKQEEQLLNLRKGTGAVPLQQARYDMIRLQVQIDSAPKKIANLEEALAERKERQLFLQREERNVFAIQQKIDQLAQKRNDLTNMKNDHEKLENNKMVELSIYSAASAGGAPMASNHMKLAFMVFGMAVLLFVGFVAFYDMPKAMPRPQAPPHAMPYGYGPPASQLPVPAWNQAMPPVPYAQPLPPHAPQPMTQPQQARTPTMNNEHLRALAERIDENLSEPGGIVLFTPTTKGLRVENLLGDLGCFLKANGGKVLVFESRTGAENPSYPAWTGPSAREVSEQLESYLEGRHERVTPCFAETLISSIDYARADLSHHLTGVMAMYRFRRLMQDMKQRYAAVLMITPERFQAPGNDEDVFTTLAEGIVVVINEDADPEEVENYLRDLRASETPVFGAVTVPPPGV